MACYTQEAIRDEIGVPQPTINGWLSKIGSNPVFDNPPGSNDKSPWGNIQHFDIWQFQKAEGESSYFGRMPPQVYPNPRPSWGYPRGKAGRTSRQCGLNARLT
jgi:hypothetical protein